MVTCVATIGYIRIHLCRETEERHGITNPVQAVNLSRSEPVCTVPGKTNQLSNVPTGHDLHCIYQMTIYSLQTDSCNMTAGILETRLRINTGVSEVQSAAYE
jgi:hypothetical protein